MGEISTKIDAIVAARKEKVDILQKQRVNISHIRDNVDHFKSLQENIKLSPERYSAFQGSGDVIGNLSNISTDEFYGLLSRYTRELDRLTERMGRDSLNISFVGSAGHGKSLVMQKISGLNGSIIPSADGSDCTGAKSVISNSNTDSVIAEITFFNHSEMISIVNKYLDKITQKAASKVSVSMVDEIQGLVSKMDYFDTLVKDDAENTAFLEHLKRYVEHYNEYISYLGKTIEVKEEDIEQYVAQYKSADTSIKYYLYLSVKNANIKCAFPHGDVGKIVLVDTIGIGATSIGVEDDMLNAIENDSDAIIYMLRPDPLRSRLDQHTVTAWKKIDNRISADYMKEMFFVVLNRVSSGKGENLNGISEMEKRLTTSTYNYAKLLNVDCSSDDDVRGNLLMPVLTQLTDHIHIVDQRLVDKLNMLGAELRQAYNAICLQTERAFVNSANEDMKRIFNDNIVNTYEGVLNELRELYIHKYNEFRQMPCEELKSECEQKLKNILVSVPKVEEIRLLLDKGRINQHDAYKSETDIFRMRIIDDFLGLNTVLSGIVDKMKREVIGIFVGKGLLGRISPFDNGVSTSDWINDFLNRIEAEVKYPLIYKALRSFDKYTINVQGFIIHEIRDRLDTIDLSLCKETPSINHGLDDKDAVAKEIEELLKDRAFDIKSKISNALLGLYKVPNKSMFAAITDLCDRLSFSKQNESHSVEREWQYLYEDWMRQIWTEEYDRQSGLQQVVGEWNDTIRSLKDGNKSESFTI